MSTPNYHLNVRMEADRLIAAARIALALLSLLLISLDPRSIDERAAALGGAVDVERDAHGNTRVAVEIPI